MVTLDKEYMERVGFHWEEPLRSQCGTYGAGSSQLSFRFGNGNAI